MSSPGDLPETSSSGSAPPAAPISSQPTSPNPMDTFSMPPPPTPVRKARSEGFLRGDVNAQPTSPVHAGSWTMLPPGSGLASARSGGSGGGPTSPQSASPVHAGSWTMLPPGSGLPSARSGGSLAGPTSPQSASPIHAGSWTMLPPGSVLPSARSGGSLAGPTSPQSASPNPASNRKGKNISTEDLPKASLGGPSTAPVNRQPTSPLRSRFVEMLDSSPSDVPMGILLGALANPLPISPTSPTLPTFEVPVQQRMMSPLEVIWEEQVHHVPQGPKPLEDGPAYEPVDYEMDDPYKVPGSPLHEIGKILGGVNIEVDNWEELSPSTVFEKISRALSFPGRKLEDIPDLNARPWRIEIVEGDRENVIPRGKIMGKQGSGIIIRKSALIKASGFSYKMCKTDEKFKEEVLLRHLMVLLLHDAEHLTALNARKRILLGHRFQDGGAKINGMMKAINRITGYENRKSDKSRYYTKEEIFKLAKEIWFLDGLLTSRLPKHARSLNLWSHRRWILKFQMYLGVIRPNIALRELRVVLLAAQMNPTNYEAWAHMRWIINITQSPALIGQINGTLTPPKLSCSTQNCRYHEKIYTTIMKELVPWCLRWPHDISGWSFLNFMISPFPVGSAPLCLSGPGNQYRCLNEDFAFVLRWVTMWKWTTESIWVFLRGVACSEFLEGGLRGKFFEGIRECKEGLGEGDGVVGLLNKADKWCRDYGPPVEA